MKRIFLGLAITIAICSLAVLAAESVAGKWKANFTTPDGTARTNTFTFKVDGANLTGTIAGATDETPLKNGKISGDEISFSADRPFGTFTYTGKVSGNEIKLKVTFNDSNFEITARRVTD